MITSINTSVDNINSNLDDIAIKDRGVKKTQKDKDILNGFINLLTTQLQNQNPMEPTDAKDVSQLLTGLIMVKQNSERNDRLEDIEGLIKTNFNNSGALNTSRLSWVVSCIDRNIKADCNHAVLFENGANFTFSLPKSASKVFAKVVDKDQRVLLEKEIGEREAGLNKFWWNGKDGKIGEEYKLQIYAVDHYGNDLKVDYTVNGIVESVEMANDKQIYLKLNNNAMVDLTQISSVSK